MKSDKQEIAAIIHEARQKAGMTKVQLARMTGVHPATVQNWEDAKFAPNPHDIGMLAKVLGIDAEQLARLRTGKEAKNSMVRLRQMRVAAGLSQTEAAARMRVGVIRVARIEEGYVKPTMEDAQMMAKAYSVPINSVMEAMANAEG